MTNQFQWYCPLLEIVCYGLIVFLAWHAMEHLWFHRSFYQELGNAPILSENATLISWLLPVLQLLLCIGLAHPDTRQSALAITLLLQAIILYYYVKDISLTQVWIHYQQTSAAYQPAIRQVPLYIGSIVLCMAGLLLYRRCYRYHES